jgi:hypothetical protein
MLAQLPQGNEPHRALARIRRGEHDLAPVPLGDLRTVLLDPALARFVRVVPRGIDQLVVHGLPADVRRALAETVDRGDYALLIPEDPAAALGRPAPRVFRAAKRRLAALGPVRVRIRTPQDPTLLYGARLLAAAWRDLGIDARLGGAASQLELVRAPRLRPGAIPVARAFAAYLVRCPGSSRCP